MNFITTTCWGIPKLLKTFYAPDTDSLCYETETDDVCQDLSEDKNLFDNSYYLVDSPFHFNDKKTAIGKMKDEAAGIPIAGFVGCEAKCIHIL